MEDHSSGRREVISVTDWCGMEGKSAQARTKPHCERCCLADICKKNGVS